MIDAEHISIFFGTGVLVWFSGFTWGRAAAWLRALTRAA